MSRMSRIWTLAAAIAVMGALLLPASGAVAAPTAQKSGAIINYTSLGKIRIKKHMNIFFNCAVPCNATSTSTIKGLGGKITIPASGSLAAGPGVLQLTIKGLLLKLMKQRPGAFKLVNKIVATDPTTGATDTIHHTFRLKR
jgi:hypothetical protein